jgi:hypothetical protein
MIVSSNRCLQAVGKSREQVSNDCEFEGSPIVNQSELKIVLFASKAYFVCKFLHIALQDTVGEKVGGRLRDMQQLAGHASLAMTQRYIEGDTEAKRKLMALI